MGVLVRYTKDGKNYLKCIARDSQERFVDIDYQPADKRPMFEDMYVFTNYPPLLGSVTITKISVVYDRKYEATTSGRYGCIRVLSLGDNYIAEVGADFSVVAIDKIVSTQNNKFENIDLRILLKPNPGAWYRFVVNGESLLSDGFVWEDFDISDLTIGVSGEYKSFQPQILPVVPGEEYTIRIKTYRETAAYGNYYVLTEFRLFSIKCQIYSIF